MRPAPFYALIWGNPDLWTTAWRPILRFPPSACPPAGCLPRAAWWESAMERSAAPLSGREACLTLMGLGRSEACAARQVPALF